MGDIQRLRGGRLRHRFTAPLRSRLGKICMFMALVLLAAIAFAQSEPPPVDFVCPMDPDVHSPTPGKCPRCGMALVPGIPDPLEYELELSLKPAAPKPGAPVVLAFKIIDPRDDKQVTDFQVVHEKLFHLFLVSQDLSWFAHEHPDF